MSCQQNRRIHPQMTIEEILGMFPNKAQKLAQEITNAGLHCVGCHAATWETLEAGMYGHGMDAAGVQKLTDRLNNLLEEQESDPEIVSLTQRGAKKFIAILDEEGKQGWGLRFGQKMGGCSGFEYILDYSEKADPEDVIFENFGVEIHISKHDLSLLKGSEIDYVDGLQGSGFKISNPNVKSSCGCGKSQGY